MILIYNVKHFAQQMHEVKVSFSFFLSCSFLGGKILKKVHCWNSRILHAVKLFVAQSEGITTKIPLTF